METELFFKVEKLITHGNQVAGYFVTKSNKLMIKNPLNEFMKMMGADEGEQYKEKVKEAREERLFFPTKKEAIDYIIYRMDEL
jgi:hypothetical protein